MKRVSVAAGLILAACTSAPAPSGPPPSAPPPLEGLDTTPLQPLVTVNETRVGTLDDSGLTLDGALPPLPWTVAATTPTGRVLVTLAVPVDPVMGTYARADLSCGVVLLSIGSERIYGPAPPPAGPVGAPGDCEP